MGCKVVELGYMRPRRGILESDDILAKDSHTICLGAYQDEANATETINRFLESYQDGQIKTPEDIMTQIASGHP